MLNEAEYISSLGIDGIMNIDVSEYSKKIRNIDKKLKCGSEMRSDLNN